MKAIMNIITYPLYILGYVWGWMRETFKNGVEVAGAKYWS